MFASKHNPGGTTLHCDNGRIESLIAEYQTTGNVRTLAAIVNLTQRRALTLIRFYKTTRYQREDELLSDVNFKLLKAVGSFNRERGHAFSFVSQVVTNALRTSVTNARKRTKQYVKLDKAAANKLHTNGESQSRDAIDDLAHRIKAGAKTTIANPTEQDVQRWFVTSFCQDGFSQYRHECADAAMAVYNLTHERSRELYDLTMLEVRRVLYDDIKRRAPIIAGRFIGTRLAWMARYARLLSQDEFTKFVVLVKGLSPFVLLLIDPANCRDDRTAARQSGAETLNTSFPGIPPGARCSKEWPGAIVLTQMRQKTTRISLRVSQMRQRRIAHLPNPSTTKQREIGEALGVGQATVNRDLSDSNQSPPKSKPPLRERDEAKELEHSLAKESLGAITVAPNYSARLPR